MIYVGIDMGSTATKVVVQGDEVHYFLMPTGWNSKETAVLVKEKLQACGVDTDSEAVITAATGYGRVSVDFADHEITEITCHGKGGFSQLRKDCTIIDVGGQDTKVIQVKGGKVIDFIMNDKCSAGTGKFLEVMAARLEVSIDQLFQLAQKGNPLPISSLCTVFAESEIISYIGQGRDREDIAAGVVDSVAVKVAQLYERQRSDKPVLLTGGLSHCSYFAQIMEHKIGNRVNTTDHGRYTGALGAAVIAEERKKQNEY